MEEYVKILQEMILDDDFIVIKFFRRIDCAFSQKDQAKECFREALKILASKDDEYSRKAKNLLGNFDNYTNSYSVRQYWDGLKIREERDKTRTDQFLLEEKKEQHLCLIDSNVITEHNQSSNRLTLESSESSESDVSATSKQNRYTLRRKRSLDIDEEQIMKKVNRGYDTTPCPRSPDSCLPRNNSGNDEPVDIIVISDDEPTDDKATNDEATDDEATDDEATDDKAKDYRIKSKDQWKVGNIDVTEKFRQYQHNLLHDVKYGIKVLTWKDIFDVLALGSIIVLDWPCPYNVFSSDEWLAITNNNPFKLTEPVLNNNLTSLLYDATSKASLGLTTNFRNTNCNDRHSQLAKRIFCDLVDDVPVIVPRRTSEDEHRFQFLDPFLKPIFGGPYKNYNLRFNRIVYGTQKRPDFSCIVDEVPILNSEVKPIGYTRLQKDKDYIKVNLRAKKTINILIKNGGVTDQTAFLLTWVYIMKFSIIYFRYIHNRSFEILGKTVESFIMDLEYEGIYRSWPFLKSDLVIDRQTLPLLTSTFSHFVALERHVNSLARDYKGRPRSSKPVKKDKFIRDLPDSPQLKRLLK
ncbi:5855_t:CDS:2 [Funneliformis caledonium]|uniref:5855_t:CDS:1 n=1 Tax=Funneliformis caledonium TaxID=1117310 RepID=A0A9N9EJ33_9GLOM|nr:5855_t:CDS:2 [Funneliformis caledonium]